MGEFVKDFQPDHLLTVGATELSIKYVGRPVPNVPLLGAFAAATGLITLDAVQAAIGQKFKGAVAQGNKDAARDAYEIAKQHALKTETHHA